jgi:SAM-dependent methyltransferase
MKDDIVLINKDGWDKISPQYFGKTALPQYGPLIAAEEELNLLENVQGKKVLDIGCGSGHSLEYMADRGAEELWGLDLSSAQIAAAEQYLKGKNLQAKLFCAPMEKDIGLPKEYFDIVYSIYAIGWTTDLKQTVRRIHSYLKQNGEFIFSWDHPMYQCIKILDGHITIDKSYMEEGFEYIDKCGEPMYVNKIKLGTYINELAGAGFKLERLVEGDLSGRYLQEVQPRGSYYTLEKASKVPSSFVVKAIKL